jgi:hypothetical protein
MSQFIWMASPGSPPTRGGPCRWTPSGPPLAPTAARGHGVASTACPRVAPWRRPADLFSAPAQDIAGHLLQGRKATTRLARLALALCHCDGMSDLFLTSARNIAGHLLQPPQQRHRRPRRGLPVFSAASQPPHLGRSRQGGNPSRKFGHGYVAEWWRWGRKRHRF